MLFAPTEERTIVEPSVNRHIVTTLRNDGATERRFRTAREAALYADVLEMRGFTTEQCVELHGTRRPVRR